MWVRHPALLTGRLPGTSISVYRPDESRDAITRKAPRLKSASGTPNALKRVERFQPVYEDQQIGEQAVHGWAHGYTDGLTLGPSHAAVTAARRSHPAPSRDWEFAWVAQTEAMTARSSLSVLLARPESAGRGSWGS